MAAVGEDRPLDDLRNLRSEAEAEAVETADDPDLESYRAFQKRVAPEQPEPGRDDVEGRAAWEWDRLDAYYAETGRVAERLRHRMWRGAFVAQEVRMHRKTQELTAPLADTLDRASSARATRGRARRRRDDDDLRVWQPDDPEGDIRKFQVGMDPARADVLAAVAAQGVAITGPLFSYHFRMTPETFDFVVGVPVAAPVAAVGRVTPGELPAARVARTVYHGPYEGLGAAWGAFETWIAAEGHARRPDLWERYLVGPEDGAEPSAWQTELSHPLGAE